MPFMDGFQLAKEVKLADHANKIIIILVSADNPSDEIKYSAMFDEIITKPIKMSRIEEIYNNINIINHE